MRNKRYKSLNNFIIPAILLVIAGLVLGFLLKKTLVGAIIVAVACVIFAFLSLFGYISIGKDKIYIKYSIAGARNNEQLKSSMMKPIVVNIDDIKSITITNDQSVVVFITQEGEVKYPIRDIIKRDEFLSLLGELQRDILSKQKEKNNEQK